MYKFYYKYKVRKDDKILTKKSLIRFKKLPESYQEFRMRLGLLIAYIREYKAIEQNVLSQKTKINLFEVENGMRDIKSNKLFELGEELNVHMSILIAFACCGDGEWTEENMRAKVKLYREQNIAERKERKRLMKNQKAKPRQS